MAELFAPPFFGISLSIVAFLIGVQIQKKTGLELCNPLLIAIVLVSAVLLVCRIPYEDYNQGGAVINLFLSPATACLAVSIYTRIQLLKENWLPILVGCTAGSLTSMGSIFVPLLIKVFRVKDPVAAGLAIGACSHAVGTSKALELGETEGAMSGLAIGVCGILTVVISLFLVP